jgi:signal peptidase II
MNNLFTRRMYQLIWFVVILSDRITKWYMLQPTTASYTVNDYLSFQLVYNRGISWGLFNSNNPLVFVALTTLIVAVVVMLYVYTLQQLQFGKTVYGPFLVLAGASSNLIDRFVYGAVVDFIVLSWGDWSFPAFNIADCAIVLGVIIMLISTARESHA